MKRNDIINKQLNLDILDRKILWQIDGNSRLPLAQLAKKLKQARDTIEYRFDRLIERGIITDFVTLIDPRRLGLSIYKVHLRLAITKDVYQKLLSDLKSHPLVYWIAECAGGWDLIFALATRDDISLYEEYLRILSRYGDVVIESSISAMVDGYLKQRGYFFEKGSQLVSRYANSREALELNDLDVEIISHLLENARISAAEIARRTDTPTATIDYRLKRLETSGLIVIYRLQINLELIGKLAFKSQIQFKTYSSKSEEALLEYCRNHPNVTFFSRQISNYPIELEYEVDSFSIYSDLISDLRGRFPDFINTISTVMLKQVSTNFGKLTQVI